MRILALDLGTRTGWAMFDSDSGIAIGGTWVLATPKEITAQKKAGLDRCCDCRFARLQTAITALGTIDVCYFEDVQFSVSTQQTQLWASFRCVVTLLYPAVTLVAVPVGTLKKFATGSGNAKKEDMAKALVGGISVANETGGRLRAMDDNEVDARHLLNLARRDYNL